MNIIFNIRVKLTLFVQTGNPIPTGHQASHYASYASITAMPVTPCSSTSREISVGTDGQSDLCADSSGGESGSSSQVDLLSSMQDDFPQHNPFRLPYHHAAPIYFLKVFAAPAPLR